MVKVWSAPQPTWTTPDGVIVPLDPAVAVIGTFTIGTKLAVIVCEVARSVNVKLTTAPCETPSTTTSAIRWQSSCRMVNVWVEPQPRTSTPAGSMLPPGPALAVRVSGVGAYTKVAAIECAARTFVNV